MTRLDYRPRRPINTAAGPTVRSWGWVTHIAFVVALAAVVARMTSTDVLREAWASVPGGDPGSRGPGPATGLAMDLLAAVPALLILGRRAIDTTYQLASRVSHLLLLPLAAWACLSVAWSADRFAAVVTSIHFAAAACLLWAASQLVRSWDRFRVVAAVCLGLLMALAVYTTMYRLVDVANTRAFWAEHREKFLKDRGWAPDSFAARQFEHKLNTGEQSAFFTSANTLAAVGVLLAFAAVTVGLQRALADRDPGWLALTAFVVLAGGWVLIVGQSKTSIVTPVLGVAALATWWWYGDPLRRRPTTAYAIGVATVTGTLLAVVCLGVVKHGLFAGHFANSLDFRWKYWTASAGVLGDHPLFGVGWANFGQSYLAHRVPDAAEEIKDPHNFLVRFATELGVVGLVLVVGWLLRLAWETTRPAADPVPTAADRPPRVTTVAWAAVAGMAVSSFAAIDSSTGLLDDLILLMRPMLMLAALLVGGMAAAMRTPHDRGVDDRPSPWIAAGVLVALGLFLLHNLIDFGWFEPGAAFAFMLLIGARLGISPAPVKPAPGRTWAVASLSAAVIAWFAVLVVVMVPVALVGQAASAADEVVRTASPSDPTVAYRRAADGYAAAAAIVPYDAALTFRAADAAVRGGDLAHGRTLAAAAAATDPKLIEAQLLLGDLSAASGDGRSARAAFDAAVRLDPNDVPIRIHYAEALDKLGDRRAAAAQYRAALAADAALPAAEPRRMSAAQVAEVEGRAQSSERNAQSERR